ncbi:histone H1-delta-like [Macrobrachium rosenbergii]|uniref:histone H1-delta-like n=1 Tax=Macrobrachium rosenbergii TaxID=79674 RepID=UPI0034D5D7A8
MADAATAAPAPAPKKAPKAKKPAAKPAHPTYAVMIADALKTLKERTGSSRQAILKHILANYKVGDEKLAGARIRSALKKGVSSGALKQVKGAGASGSFKVAKEEVKPKKAVKKPKATKPDSKKSKAKKAAKSPKAVKKATKKPAAKKAVKKPAAVKKAAKKPVAKKVK